MKKLTYKIGELVQLRWHLVSSQGTGNYANLVGMVEEVLTDDNPKRDYVVRFFNYKAIFPEGFESLMNFVQGNNPDLVFLRQGDIQRLSKKQKHYDMLAAETEYKKEYYNIK